MLKKVISDLFYTSARNIGFEWLEGADKRKEDDRAGVRKVFTSRLISVKFKNVHHRMECSRLQF
jgi:hypothetical protein